MRRRQIASVKDYTKAAEAVFAERYNAAESEIDARRMLEDKLEQKRLQKELADFDFDD